VFRSARDAELAKAIYRRVPVLVVRGQPDRNSWGVRFATLFHMSGDSDLFRSAADCEAAGGVLDGNVYRSGDGQTWLPLYEAKMVHHFTHRWGDYAMRPLGSLDTQLPDINPDQLADPAYVVQPRYWVAANHLEERLKGWDHPWLLGFRDVTNATNERTLIASVLPRAAVGHKLPLLFVHRAGHLLLATLDSFVTDYLVRQKLGGTSLGYFILSQLPFLPPETFDRPAPWSTNVTLAQWFHPRVLELTYTAWDLEGFAQDLGYNGPPFRWDTERRFLLRCELDAACFHLYGVSREDADYILDTFPIVRAYDEQVFGEYRTKRLILDIYDALTESIATRHAYRSLIQPLPANAQVAHPSQRLAPVVQLHRIEESPHKDKYRTVVPLLTLKAAAGAFGSAQEVNADAWVQVPGRKLRPGMFIARVVGHSMEPRIPSGAWCLFATPVAGSRQGKIVLAQHRDISDPETGGSYTVKRYRSTKRETADGLWEQDEVTLEPLNPTFRPIVLQGLEEHEVRVIAELTAVFPPDALQVSSAAFAARRSDGMDAGTLNNR
jgi:SOS-response transcriptional repressor LexA